MSARSVLDRLQEKLNQMNRKTYQHRGHLVKLLDWSFDGDYCQVETTREMMVEPHKTMLKRLTEDFLETEEELPDEEMEKSLSVPKEPIVSVPKLKSFEACDTFMDALTRAMEKVEADPNFKDQAKAMTDIAGKAIDYAKVQVDAYKVASEIMRKN